MRRNATQAGLTTAICPASRLDYLRELGMTNDPFESIENFRDVESINA
ncbi:MAG: hypothetical protein PUB14_00155 [Lachnospiraceae bacterium]|nr:hypothetical protein [Lachnospiraceae bacterium]